MTLQKKLDKLGDRLKKNHETLHGKDTKLSGYIDASNEFPNSYDLHAKGLKYDALEKKSVEHISDLLDKDEQIKELKERNDALTKENFKFLNKMVEMTKRNEGLVEALEGIISQVRVHDTGDWYRSEIEQADEALKNNEND